MHEVQAIYGIDFSGAQDAGNKIRIAKGVPEGSRLLVSECRKAVLEILKDICMGNLITDFSLGPLFGVFPGSL